MVDRESGINKTGKLLLLIGAVYFFLKFICPVVSPFLVAVLFVTIFGPLFLKIQKKIHVSRMVSAILFLIIGLAVTLTLGWLLISWLINSLPGWIDKLISFEEGISDSIGSTCDYLEAAFGIRGDYLEEILQNALNTVVQYLSREALPDLFAQVVPYLTFFGKLGAFLVTFVIASVLLAKDYDTIVNKMLEQDSLHIVLHVICGVIRYLAVFVKAQMILLTLIGTTCVLGLSLAQVENGLLYGLLAGVLDALPFIGTGVVLVPLAIYHAVTGQIWKAIVCLLLYVICIFIREILEPKLIGGHVGIPPIAVLFSLYVGVALFGVSGILKGPLGYLLIKLICESRREEENIPEN